MLDKHDALTRFQIPLTMALDEGDHTSVWKFLAEMYDIGYADGQSAQKVATSNFVSSTRHK